MTQATRFSFHMATGRRGSALLIVLGFLSFMIVSAVAFAVYMRTERQATSSFRQAGVTRQLLNASLARAMSQIDVEVGNRLFPEPHRWPGRVCLYATTNAAGRIDNEMANVNETKRVRVLTLEGLSFLPSFLVNDVRYYAQRANSAAWQPIRDVGRCAYVAVNVSDFFDVNTIRANVPRNISSNRVTVAHLIPSGSREKFDTMLETRGGEEEDVPFVSMQDFNSVLAGEKIDDFPGSFFEYLKSSSGGFFGGKDFTSLYDNLKRQLFITGGVRSDFLPYKDGKELVCDLGNSNHQPFAPEVLNETTGLLEELIEEISEPFIDAYGSLMNELIDEPRVFACCLKDYLDEDNVPSSLGLPTVEQVPMIVGVQLETPEAFQMTSLASPGYVDNNTTGTLYTVALNGFGKKSAGYQYKGNDVMIVDEASEVNFVIGVNLCFPFQESVAKDTFKLEGFARIIVVPEDDDAVNGTRTTENWREGQNPKTYVSNAMKLSSDTISLPADATRMTHVSLEGSVSAKMSEALFVPLDAGGPVPKLGDRIALGGKFRLKLAVWLRVMKGSDCVDMVPADAHVDAADRLQFDGQGPSNPMLYFRTGALTLNATSLAEGGLQATEWQTLETPDPRYNHAPENWKASNNSLGTGWSSTATALLGQDGRDADPYLAVSDAGRLYSPGELGFLARIPKNGGINWDAVPKSTQLQDTLPAEWSGYVDKTLMFRTYRLYAQDSADADLVYSGRIAADTNPAIPHINPLSDITGVLEAAIANTPISYYYASTNYTETVKSFSTEHTFNANTFFGDAETSSKWATFRDAWIKATTNILQTANTSTDWRRWCEAYEELDWYGADDRSIFGTDIGVELPSTARKMLYSFSRDTFQPSGQLFLIFLRAEATSSSAASVASQQGGKAVALVQRSPRAAGVVNGMPIHSMRVLMYRQFE